MLMRNTTELIVKQPIPSVAGVLDSAKNSREPKIPDNTNDRTPDLADMIVLSLILYTGIAMVRTRNRYNPVSEADLSEAIEWAVRNLLGYRFVCVVLTNTHTTCTQHLPAPHVFCLYRNHHLPC